MNPTVVNPGPYVAPPFFDVWAELGLIGACLLTFAGGLLLILDSHGSWKKSVVGTALVIAGIIPLPIAAVADDDSETAGHRERYVSQVQSWMKLDYGITAESYAVYRLVDGAPFAVTHHGERVMVTLIDDGGTLRLVDTGGDPLD